MARQPTSRRPRHWRVVALTLLLTLFGQTFHYMKDLKPLWAFSKGFPILSLPLAIPLLARQRLPALFGWLVVFLWLVLVSSLMGMFAFDQSFPMGLTAQVKLLPMLYVFSFLGLLLLVRPSPNELLTAFAWCALLTFATVFLLWALAPQSWYKGDYDVGEAPLLSADSRGNRIRMPMYFGLIALFALYRGLLQRPTWKAAGLLGIALALVVGVVKTRAVVLGVIATLGIVTFLAAPPRWRILAVGGAAVVAMGLLQVPYVQSAFDTSPASGFDVRQTTVDKAVAFLWQEPIRWVLGAGTITPLADGGLPKFFNHFFFLGDITWLGIVFEFGLVGAAMIVFLLVRTWLLAQGTRSRIDRPMIAGMQDYVLFALIQSPFYSTMMLQPGEIGVIAASFIYFGIVADEANARGRA